jgi:putative FmdB family regulatory protein
MPIYEYSCPKCGTFEVMQGIKEDTLKRCPTCKSKVDRLVSRSSFVLKGSGWYLTDYARKSDASASAANGTGSEAGKSSGSDKSAGGASSDKTASAAKTTSTEKTAD